MTLIGICLGRRAWKGLGEEVGGIMVFFCSVYDLWCILCYETIYLAFYFAYDGKRSSPTLQHHRASIVLYCTVL